MRILCGLSGPNQGYVVGMKHRIADLRKAYGVTQTDVANAIGVSSNYYARLERGESDVRQVYLEKLAQYFAVSIPELYERTPNPPKMQTAIDMLKKHFSNGDLSDELSGLCLLIGSMDPKQVLKLREHAQLLTAATRG